MNNDELFEDTNREINDTIKTTVAFVLFSVLLIYGCFTGSYLIAWVGILITLVVGSYISFFVYLLKTINKMGYAFSKGMNHE